MMVATVVVDVDAVATGASWTVVANKIYQPREEEKRRERIELVTVVRRWYVEATTPSQHHVSFSLLGQQQQ